LLALRDVLGQGEGGDDLLGGITRSDPPLARHRDDAVCAVMPAAARERQAAALGQSLRQAAGLIQLPEPGVLRAALAGSTWDAIAGPLGALALGPKPDAPRRAVTTLTLADLRRFLECPLQGSVRVLLPMRDDEDAEDEAEAALRERENLGDARIETLPLLRDIFGRAIDADATDDDALAERYDAAFERLRLAGTLPSGLFGAVVRTHHLALLRSWREGLREALQGALPTGLAPNWYGAAPEHRRDVAIAPAIPLSVPLPDGPREIVLLGQSEPLSLVDGDRMAVTLTGRRRRDYVERDRLRAWLTHLALAASGVGAGRPLATLVLGGDRDGQPAGFDAGLFEPIAADDARALLVGLAADLLADVHPYLLPCEGVFTWRRRQRKGQAMTVREAVLLIRDDQVTRISSERGPVADARRYPVPAERDANAYVDRRFEPYFQSFKEIG
jgi:exodeoxyribonuclease V gamma subunit